mmetsp:Transcript_7708/g.19142  ORF Transcript_7708/g.19142 Transcript_7708/m.19142 type:complete len:178 (+) Transcript_7708:2-535(+)
MCTRKPNDVCIKTSNSDADDLSYSNLQETLRMNDSGYFTARGTGSAWVKSKYYNNNKILEEIEPSIDSITSSTISNVDGKYKIGSEIDALSDKDEGTDDDATNDGTWLFGCIEFILRVVLYLLHSLLTWSKRSTRLGRVEDITTSKVKPGDSSYLFVSPPDHVAEAMERLKRSKHFS